MKDGDRTREQLISELVQMRQRATELEASEAECKKAQEAIRESEERYRRFIESSHEVVFSKDRDGHYHTLNLEAAIGLGGTCVDDIEGKTDYDLLPKQQADALREVDRQTMESVRAVSVEEVVRNAQAVDRTYLSHKWPTLDSEGRVTGVSCLAVDITERKQAEEALRRQRDLSVTLSATDHLAEALRLCLQAAIGAAGMDSGGIYLVGKTDGSVNLLHHQGLSPEFVRSVSHFPADSVHASMVMAGQPVYSRHEEMGLPLDEPLIREGLRALAVVPLRYEGRVIACLNVASHTIDELSAPVRDSLEAISAQVGGAIARVGAEQALKDSEEKLRRMFDSVSDGITTADVNGVITGANRRVLEMHSYHSREALIGSSAFDLIAPRDHGRAMANLQKTLEEGMVGGIEYTLVRADGSEFPGELGASVLHDASGNADGFIAVTRDITERKQAEQVLQLERDKLTGILDSMEDGVYIANSRYGVEYANPVIEAQFGPVKGRKCYQREFRSTFSQSGGWDTGTLRISFRRSMPA